MIVIQPLMDEIRSLFAEMKGILEAEGEANWIRGIELLLNTLSADHPSSDAEKMAYVRQTYRSMHAGAGSFADCYVQRSDFDERVKANKRFGEIKDRVWELLS
jgi:hypothetical protein